MAQSKAFTDASHALNDLSHALALLEAENSKLREFATQMANALGIDSEWKNPYEDCKSSCKLKFGCCACRSEALCPAWARMTELGIEVPS